LEQVILHHVPQGTGLIKIARSLTDARFLGHCDLHMIDVMPIPQWLDDRIRKPKHQQILYGLFPQIMIDSIDLLFVVVAMQLSIEFAGAGEIRAEGFLNNDSMLPNEAVETRLIEIANDVDEISWWNSQIENNALAEPRSRFADLLEQVLIACRVRVIALDVIEALNEPTGRCYIQIRSILLSEGVIKMDTPTLSVPITTSKRDKP
jgi:hypothetical protein